MAVYMISFSVLCKSTPGMHSLSKGKTRNRKKTPIYRLVFAGLRRIALTSTGCLLLCQASLTALRMAAPLLLYGSASGCTAGARRRMDCCCALARGRCTASAASC